LKYQGQNKNIENIKTLVSVLPEMPGIYQFFDDNGTIIYVGKAKNIKRRVSSYLVKNHDNRKTAILVRNIAKISHMVVETEQDALLLENNLIKKYQPRYNIRLKDDKSYPWICIKNEPFPRVFQTRNVYKDGSKYFGPYTSVYTVRTLLELFKSQFKLRTCNYHLSEENINNRKFKICLEYHIGNCEAPCGGFINQDKYSVAISAISEILKGNINGVIKHLDREMKKMAEKMNFEEAQKLKEKLNSLNSYQSRSTIVSPTITDVDVFTIEDTEKYAFVNYLKIIKGAIVQTYTLEIQKSLSEPVNELLITGMFEIRQKIFSNAKEILLPFGIDTEFEGIRFVVPKKGDKLKLVELSKRNAKYFRLEKEKQDFLKNPKATEERILGTIKSDLQLKETPVHIECFDNSNFQGKNAVAACVVFKNGKPYKSEYRHYNIKTVDGPNDFASMEEVVFRRYSRMLDENALLPQLIVVDGGKGQLSSAVSSLKKLNLYGKIPIIGIAKNLEEIYFPGDSVPIYINKNSETLKVIQHLRDEAHRFGISFHRDKRSRDFVKSELVSIEGIGEKTCQRLLREFKSVHKIKSLSTEELTQFLGPARAKIVFGYFHPVVEE
jgi:excinuclease ABC subunit C